MRVRDSFAGTPFKLSCEVSIAFEQKHLPLARKMVARNLVKEHRRQVKLYQNGLKSLPVIVSGLLVLWKGLTTSVASRHLRLRRILAIVSRWRTYYANLNPQRSLE
jgi:hypothetical protein